MDKLDQITDHLVHLSGIKDGPILLILRSVLEQLYKPAMPFAENQIAVIPQTSEEMLRHSIEPSSRIEWIISSRLLIPDRIFLNCDARNITILWDLLHEFGHLIDGPPTEESGNRPKDMERESRAWANGRSHIKDLPSFLEQYDSHALMCLDTYH